MNTIKTRKGKGKKQTRTRTNTRPKKSKSMTKKIKMKGGNNPFSDIFGMWGTMTYNLSNAISVFSITPPTAHMNQPHNMDPSPGKQFL